MVRFPPSAYHIQLGSRIINELPNLFYEHVYLTAIAQIEEVRAKTCNFTYNLELPQAR
jgi:hypothetical protein